jgi:hypothetical protein
MLIPRNALSETSDRHGSQSVSLAKLRSALEDPSRLTDFQRQRLMTLERKLDRIRALGDEYAGIELSENARIAIQATHSTRAVG